MALTPESLLQLVLPYKVNYFRRFYCLWSVHTVRAMGIGDVLVGVVVGQ